MSRKELDAGNDCCITSRSIVIAAANARANIFRACIIWKIGWPTTIGAVWSTISRRSLGGMSVPHSAREMTIGWRHYRYLKANRSLLKPLAQMEARVSSRPLYQIPKSRVSGVESKLRSGDIIGIVSRDRGGLYSTAHVGLALRTSDGVLHFMHASSPSNSGRVVVDSRLSSYLARYRTDSGILVARPLR